MGIYRVKQTDTSTWCHRNQSCCMRPRICLFVCAVSCLKGTVQYIKREPGHCKEIFMLVYRPLETERFNLPHELSR